MASKFGITGFVFTMVILYAGGFLANFVIPMMPFDNAWISGIVTGMIQFLLLAVFGLASGKMDVTTIIIGGVILFVGGILGGIIVGFIGLSDLYALIVTLAVQTLLLALLGYVKGARAPKLGKIG